VGTQQPSAETSGEKLAALIDSFLYVQLRFVLRAGARTIAKFKEGRSLIVMLSFGFYARVVVILSPRQNACFFLIVDGGRPWFPSCFGCSSTDSYFFRVKS
jgi:hypothetical protein